jgi:single-stranded DNA-binding protein
VSDINKVHLLGTVDATPVLSETTRGVKTLNLWVKTVDKDQRAATHKVVAWGKLARERVWKKGDRICVHGSIQHRAKWSNHSESSVPIVDIVAHRLEHSS